MPLSPLSHVDTLGSPGCQSHTSLPPPGSASGKRGIPPLISWEMWGLHSGGGREEERTYSKDDHNEHASALYERRQPLLNSVVVYSLKILPRGVQPAAPRAARGPGWL